MAEPLPSLADTKASRGPPPFDPSCSFFGLPFFLMFALSLPPQVMTAGVSGAGLGGELLPGTLPEPALAPASTAAGMMTLMEGVRPPNMAPVDGGAAAVRPRYMPSQAQPPPPGMRPHLAVDETSALQVQARQVHVCLTRGPL